MQHKYLVEIYDDLGELIKAKSFKTKVEIAQKYNLTLQLIDRIIKLSNNPDFKLKKIHKQYEDFYKKIKIILIKKDICLD